MEVLPSGGSYNCAFGAFALSANLTGHYNSAVGAGALASNTTGEDNTSTGYLSLNSNTTGNFNTASGGYHKQQWETWPGERLFASL